ncbi:ArnT family glycosyltransferase [Patescibacteria group bacterium]
MTNKVKVILFLIIVVAAVLRLVSLGNNPSHLSQDEAALGYNAYSILKTGKDEYGQVLPLVFKSFGDYKPGLYIYMTVPSVLVFGLSEFAVRLPSALAGILAVYLVFRIVVLAVSNDNSKRNGITLGLLASFFLAINPLHVNLSRAAWETNLSLTLVLLAILMFYKALNKP